MLTCIDVKFIFHNVRLGLSSSANILQNSWCRSPSYLLAVFAMFLSIILPSSSCNSYSWNEWSVRHFCFHNQNSSTWYPGLLGNGALTLFRLVGGRGLFDPPPSGKIVITPTRKELWRSNFLPFSKIYLGTFWCNYHVHVINHVAMATSFWHIGFGKFKKWWFFCFKIAFLHL